MYKLFLLDSNTFKKTFMCKLFVIDKNIDIMSLCVKKSLKTM